MPQHILDKYLGYVFGLVLWAKADKVAGENEIKVKTDCDNVNFGDWKNTPFTPDLKAFPNEEAAKKHWDAVKRNIAKSIHNLKCPHTVEFPVDEPDVLKYTIFWPKHDMTTTGVYQFKIIPFDQVDEWAVWLSR